MSDDAPNPAGAALPETPLTLAQQAAIRSYMISLITLPAIALAIVSFVVGFGINEVARSEAKESAFNIAARTMLDTTSQVAVAKGQTDEILVEFSEAKKLLTQNTLDVRATVDQVNDILNHNIENFSNKVTGNETFTTKLATIIAASQVFKDRLVKANASDVDDLKVRFHALSNWPSLPATVIPWGWGGVCPDGTYVVGVEFQKAGGGPDGFFRAAQLTCRKLTAPPPG